MSGPRYEVVSTADDAHFWRFIASNGKEISRSSQVYRQLRSAENAIECQTGHFIARDEAGAYTWNGSGRVEVRYVTALTEVKRPELKLAGA